MADTANNVEDSKHTPAARDRWTSRVTFVLGAIGSAVGLGNLWRFPFLSFRWGGGAFLIPYLCAFLLLGIPLLYLELTLGRRFQGGDPVCFNAMHPRLVGIGWMSTYGSFIVVSYYTVVIGWVLIYFIESFYNPLPWAGTYINDKNETKSNANAHFYGDTLRLSSGPTVQETTNPDIVIATFVAWILVFLSIFRGVGVVSQVVKWSVPVPLVLLVVLLVNSATQEGAADGINAYIGKWDLSVLSESAIWQQATGQIFFSIGVCYGIMTAYSSYMGARKGVMTDAVVIATCNSAISIFAGFVVFTAVGVLAADLGVEIQDLSISGPGLVFVAYPYALAEIGVAPGFFSVIFFLSIFLLAIDSAFSIVEAVVTGLHDTSLGQTIPRDRIVAYICLLGFSFSFFFQTDNGLYNLDVVDYYVNNLIMLGVGAAECIASTWVYGYGDSVAEIGDKAVKVYNAMWFLATFFLLALFNGIEYSEDNTHIIASFVVFAIFAILSFIVAKGQISNSDGADNWFYALLFSGGASKFTKMLIESEYGDTKSDPKSHTRFYILVHIWALLVKYFIPIALAFMVAAGIKGNQESPYEGYEGGIQTIGHFEVLLAWVIFLTFFLIGIDSYQSRAVIITEDGYQVVYGAEARKQNVARSKMDASDDDMEQAEVVDESVAKV